MLVSKKSPETYGCVQERKHALSEVCVAYPLLRSDGNSMATVSDASLLVNALLIERFGHFLMLSFPSLLVCCSAAASFGSVACFSSA